MQSRIKELAALFESEHQHPVNRAIHFWVGMPLVGLALLLFALRKWRGIVLLALGYSAMFFGHYRYEKRPPMVAKSPLGPLAAGAFVIDRLALRPLHRG
jgi:hypothetical protein